MADIESQPYEAIVAAAAPAPDGVEKSRKKRDKVRSAWISFAGRIVAQFVGSAATIALGVVVLHNYRTDGRTDASPREVAAPHTSEPRVVATRGVQPADDFSVAVLPLVSFAADGRREYVADATTDMLIAQLAQIERLRVVSRTSVMPFKKPNRSLPAIADELHVRYIVEGPIAHAGNRVRITAQLIDASRDAHVWAQAFERPSNDLFAVQAEVTQAIARAVDSALDERTGGSLRPVGLALPRPDGRDAAGRVRQWQRPAPLSVKAPGSVGTNLH